MVNTFGFVLAHPLNGERAAIEADMNPHVTIWPSCPSPLKDRKVCVALPRRSFIRSAFFWALCGDVTFRAGGLRRHPLIGIPYSLLSVVEESFVQFSWWNTLERSSLDAEQRMDNWLRGPEFTQMAHDTLNCEFTSQLTERSGF